MKTRVIPAQITTVEDKIAGSLNFTQIILLMIPIFWLMIVYTLLYPQMQFAWYKLPLFLIVLLSCLILAVRIKGKVIIHWLIILLRYNTRPTYYLFDKNEAYLRTLDLVVQKQRKSTAKSPAKQKKEAQNPDLSIGDLIRLEGIIANPKYNLSIKTGKKGGLRVAFEQNQK